MQTTKVTAENINAIRDMLPPDIREEVKPGCLVWALERREGGKGCYWPEEGRVAVAINADSVWGDEAGEGSKPWARLVTDEGVTLDALTGYVVSES